MGRILATGPALHPASSFLDARTKAATAYALERRVATAVASSEAKVV